VLSYTFTTTQATPRLMINTINAYPHIISTKYIDIKITTTIYSSSSILN